MQAITGMLLLKSSMDHQLFIPLNIIVDAPLVAVHSVNPETLYSLALAFLLHTSVLYASLSYIMLSMYQFHSQCSPL